MGKMLQRAARFADSNGTMTTTMTERRCEDRLSYRLPVEYRPCGSVGRLRRAITRNVSPGGVQFEATDEDLRRGMELELSLKIPPSPGVAPFETQVSTIAEVIRIDRPADDHQADRDGQRVLVGARFSRPLRFDAHN